MDMTVGAFSWLMFDVGGTSPLVVNATPGKMFLGAIAKATEHETDQSASSSPPLFLPLMLPGFLPLRMDNN